MGKLIHNVLIRPSTLTLDKALSKVSAKPAMAGHHGARLNIRLNSEAASALEHAEDASPTWHPSRMNSRRAHQAYCIPPDAPLKAGLLRAGNMVRDKKVRSCEIKLIGL